MGQQLHIAPTPKCDNVALLNPNIYFFFELFYTWNFLWTSFWNNHCTKFFFNWISLKTYPLCEIIYWAFCDKSENTWGYFRDVWSVFWKYIKSAIYHKACVNIWITRRKNVNTLSYSFLLSCTHWKSIGPSFRGLEKKLKIRSVWENAYHDNDVYDNNDDNRQGTEVLMGGIRICIIISLHYTLPVIITIVISIVFPCISFPINNDRNGYKCQE